MSQGGDHEETVDLLVIGSGAGALSAAVTAAHLGLQVTVVEKEPLFGGTTAWSGGWMWIPRNPLAVAAGIQEDLDGPRSYLRATLGGAAYGTAHDRLEAFLASSTATPSRTSTAAPRARAKEAARSAPHPSTRRGWAR